MEIDFNLEQLIYKKLKQFDQNKQRQINLEYQRTEAYQELMEELGRQKCNVCNCWVVNFKRHLMSRKHYKQVEWNLQCGITPVEWETKEDE